jgi:autotransporter translocation and assembly factor TamB
VGSEIAAVFESRSMHSKALSAESTLHFTLKELLSDGPREAAAAYERHLGAYANTLALTHSEATFSSPKFRINADAASCEFFLAHDAVRGERLLITRGENRIAGSMAIGFEKAENFKLTRAAANLEIKCPRIRSESLVVSQHALTGTIEGSVSAGYDGKSMEGDVRLHGANLEWGRLGIPILRINGNAVGGIFKLQELYASFGPEQTIQCSGETGMVEPFAYQLDADLRFSKLDSMQALLEQAGITGPLSGGVEAVLKGSGKLTDFSGTGEWKLHGKKLQFKSLKLEQLDFEGTYSPGQLRAHTAQVAGPNARLSAEVAWSKNTLHFSNISLRQKGTEVLSGQLRLPLTRDSEGTHWVKDGLIDGVLSGSKIDLSNVLPNLDGKPTLTGSLGLSLNLSGTAENPVASLSASGKSLRTVYYPSLGNCELDLNGRYASGTIHADALLSGPLGTPLRVQAKAAVDLDDLLGGRIDWAALPVELSAKIADAKLQALPKIFPQLRDIKGTGTLDARMRGSLSTPIWEGAITTDCEFVHFQTDRIPAITDLHANVQLDGNHLHIRRARADIGGGGLQAEGTVIFENPKNPTLRIDVKAQQVLVQRTEQISLRLNGNLHAEGAWTSATVTGKLFAVKSMVRRDIELLPITSMQTGGSGYKRSPGKPWFTFPLKPLLDWKLNIHILTLPGDPIQIRGNRLRGTAKVDIHLLGSGAAPTLEGSYISDDVVALLPFARVEVSRGRVWYSADAPFLPQTEFTAESEIRNHRIRMYLHGPPENPQVSVSSDPPLAERDALTLLTAGVLPGDFASESSHAASSRAASLLVQEFSDKVLLRDGANERFSALRRFSLDVGALNSRTGNQETRLTYRLQDNMFMIGEIGANGDFATRLRYIFRFH